MAETDTIIIGSGLAGLTTALSILDRNGTCVILEKCNKLGGNSMKASSGINAGATDAFLRDTMTSAAGSARPDLIETLIGNSNTALSWLVDRLGVDLNTKTQLGGHSEARTYRPRGKLPVGAEIMLKLQSHVKKFEATRRLVIHTNAQVVELLTNEVGVEYHQDQQVKRMYCEHIVLATGGFAADRTPLSILAQFRPELVNFPATSGSFATGDGLRLAKQASCVNLDKIQLHPTGFIDPKDPANPNKFLAAELLRGVGGILIDSEGERFVNELGRRDYVVDGLLSLNDMYALTKQWRRDWRIPTAYIVLSARAAAEAQGHVSFYLWKGFLTKVKGIKGLASYMNIEEMPVKTTLSLYKQASRVGSDDHGKTRFPNIPDRHDDHFYIGMVTPVLHYCMGGLSIDTYGRVLDTNNNTIHGLYACGEVAGGVHGDNRLAGNSLLECVVFGRIVSNSILEKCEQV